MFDAIACPTVLSLGSYWEDGNLVVRQPSRLIKLSISPGLWNLVCQTCDGRRSVAQVAQAMRNATSAEDPPAEPEALLQDLGAAGVLVDAAHLLPAYAEVVDPSLGWGRAQPPAAWAALPVPLDVCSAHSDVAWMSPWGAPRWSALVSERRSAPGWQDAPVTKSQLGAVLRCYALASEGPPHAVGGTTPHRAVASGGALYALRIFVVLLRAIEDLSPGVHEVRYALDGRVGLRKLHGDIRPAWRACDNPGLLTGAVGWMVLAGDVGRVARKYRNRAYPNLLIEAGLVLQNFSLLCAEVGLGGRLVAGFSERRLRALCGCDSLPVLGSAIFGVSRPGDAAPPDVQLPWHGETRAWAEEVREMAHHQAVAQLPLDDGSSLVGIGRDEDPVIAHDKALSELVERCGMSVPFPSVRARITDLREAVHPGEILRYAPSAHADPDFAFDVFRSELEHEWVAMRVNLTGQQVWVLKDFCFGHDAAGPQRPYTVANSSGMACAPTVEWALYNALLELIERDAFMRVWIRQSPVDALPRTVVPADAQKTIDSLQALGCTVEFRALPSAFSPVCLAIIRHHRTPWAMVAARAAASWPEAIRESLKEISAVSMRQCLISEQAESLAPADVIGPDDHRRLYTQAEYVRRLDFLSTSIAQTPDKLHSPPSDSLQNLMTTLAAKQLRLLWHEIPVPGAPDYAMGGRPRVVRAIVPGLVAMTFGWQCTPWLGEAINHPDSAFPHPFG